MVPKELTLFITIYCSSMLIKAKFCYYLILHLVPWSIASCSGLLWACDEFFQQMVLLPVKNRQIFSSPHGGKAKMSSLSSPLAKQSREKDNQTRKADCIFKSQHINESRTQVWLCSFQTDRKNQWNTAHLTWNRTTAFKRKNGYSCSMLLGDDCADEFLSSETLNF